MDDKEIEIMAWCSSETEGVSLGFGISYNPQKHPDGLPLDWVYEGMADSFWENYRDFEPGIDKARQLVCNSTSMTLEQALFEVFGHFNISYVVDGVEKNLGYDIDADKAMYPLLENVNG